MFYSERLSPHHDTGTFDCGNRELNAWLTTSASGADAANTARTFVWVEGGRVVAYLSLCPHEVRRDTLPGSLGRSGPAAIPAILLAKLALDKTLQGQGLGADLIVDALGRAVRAVDAAGGRVIVVDAIDETAASFYRHFGFTPCTEPPLRLVRKASEVAHALQTVGGTADSDVDED